MPGTFSKAIIMKDHLPYYDGPRNTDKGKFPKVVGGWKQDGLLSEDGMLVL